MAASHKLARASMRALYARPLFMPPTRFLSTTQTLWATEKPTLPADPLPDAATQAPDLSFPATDWSTSFSGLSHTPFKKEIADILLAPLDHGDIEIKPDGIMYLPEIKYRRVLNKAFGPGGWGLAPRSDTRVEGKQVSREYALVCLGRLVAVARGEQDFFDPSGVATATEGCKSNALMRCCKDLGIGSELWDPRFIRQWKAKYAVNVFATNSSNNQKKKLWRRKDDPPFSFPWTESPAGR